MAVIVGIDEAGYGPLLGPLVVSATAFTVPDELLKADMWKVLDKAVGKAKRGLSGRVLITDSKKAYTKSSGVGHLRRSVLASLVCCGGDAGFCGTAGEMLRAVCPGCYGRLGPYAWYDGLDGLSLGADKGDVEIAASVLGKALGGNAMSIRSVASRCLDVGYYNGQVELVKNKSNVLFTALCGLIKEVCDGAGSDEEMQVIVDRQGGRVRYGGPLMRMFPGMELSILRESEEMSSYEMIVGGKKMRLHFTMKADQHFLPVSLASMISKYVREVMMESINNYFQGFCPDIKRTAGYWQDGLRFVADIAAMAPGVKYDPAMFIRTR